MAERVSTSSLHSPLGPGPVERGHGDGWAVRIAQAVWGE